MALLRGSVRINTTAISITTATSGCNRLGCAASKSKMPRFHKSLMAIRRLLLDRGQEMHVVMCISKSLPVRESASGWCLFRHDCLCSSSRKGIINLCFLARA
jgi:hypothetical protein